MHLLVNLDGRNLVNGDVELPISIIQFKTAVCGTFAIPVGDQHFFSFSDEPFNSHSILSQLTLELAPRQSGFGRVFGELLT